MCGWKNWKICWHGHNPVAEKAEYPSLNTKKELEKAGVVCIGLPKFGYC